MSMEKNGAISSGTPQQGCCGGGCDSEKKASTQLELKFPDSEQAANELENDVTKEAIDAVEAQAQKNRKNPAG